MGKYWQPCGASKECQVEDDKLDCVEKTGLPNLRWCEGVRGGDLREGWCVNRTLTDSQKDDYVRLKQVAFIDNQNMED